MKYALLDLQVSTKENYISHYDVLVENKLLINTCPSLFNLLLYCTQSLSTNVHKSLRSLHSIRTRLSNINGQHISPVGRTLDMDETAPLLQHPHLTYKISHTTCKYKK